MNRIEYRLIDVVEASTGYSVSRNVTHDTCILAQRARTSFYESGLLDSKHGAQVFPLRDEIKTLGKLRHIPQVSAGFHCSSMGICADGIDQESDLSIILELTKCSIEVPGNLNFVIIDGDCSHYCWITPTI